MKIKAVVLKNFRQYKYEVILFPPEGIIGIVGQNGKGKSTIFNSIGWAFYGKIKDVLNEDIKNTDAGPREECFVIVFFEYKGETYVIKRHFSKKDETFLKTIHGRPLVTSGRRELTNYITNRFFKMDYPTFCACYYAQQDDFDALSKMTPAKRRETLTRLLRIDMLDKATDKVKDEIKEHAELVEELERVLTKENQLLENIQKAKEKIQDHKKLIKEANSLIDSLTNKYKDLLVQRADGEVLNQTFQNLKNEYKDNLQQLKMLEERILKQDKEELERLMIAEKRYNEIKSSIDEYNQLLEEKEESSQFRSLYQEKMNLATQLKSIKNEVDGFKVEYRTLQSEVKGESDFLTEYSEITLKKEKMTEEMQIKQTLIQEKNFEIRSFKEQLQRLKETKEKFESLGKDSPCPMCERPLGEHFDNSLEHIKSEQEPLVTKGREVQHERDIATEELEIMKKEYEELILSEKNVLRNIQAIDKKKDRMSFIQQQVNSLNSKYMELMPRYQELKDVQFNNDAYNELIKMIQKAKILHDEAIRIQPSLNNIPVYQQRIEKSTSEIATLKETLSSIEKQVNELGFDEVAYKSLTAKIEELQNQIHEQKENTTKFTYEIKTSENHIEMNKEQLTEIKEARKKIVNHKNRMAFLLKLVESYKGYKTEIIAQLVPDLSTIMSEDIEKITDGYYDQIELDRDFNIHIYRLGEKKPLTFYSGGEQKLAALIQLLGVSHLLTNQTGQASFDMVAMDEVLGSFDDNRQSSTIEQLRNLKDVFPQVLMVAHQELVKDMFDYTLIVTTDEKRHSQTKWLQQWNDTEIKEMVEPFLAS